MKLLIYDKTTKDIPGFTWKLGRHLLGHRFDEALAAESWDHALGWLVSRPTVRIDELHYWGHGRPAEPILGGEALISVDRLPMIQAIGDMTQGGLVWFRCCAAFQGVKGQAFAEAIRDLLKCRVAGHTHNIGFPCHSGLYSLGLRQVPPWSPDEGVGKDGRILWSGPRQPRSIFTLRQTVPAGW